MWKMDSLIRLLEDLRNVQSFSFEVGYIAAIGLVLGLIVIIALLYLLFFKYPRRSSGIFIHAPLGTVFIAAHAVSDLVKSLEAEYKDIEIVKVLLLDCKSFKRVEIQVDYALGGASMTEIAPSLQERALQSLKDVFGVDCVRDVAVRVRRAVSNQSPF
jgi:hypothetical protein